MVLYICEKCNKEFSKISHYKTHINKKIPCNNNSDKLLKPKKIEKTNKNECSHCLKIFSSKSNLSKHVKNNCKIIKEKQKNTINNNINPNIKKIIKIIEQNDILIKKNKKLQKNLKIKNIENQQNNQINININVYDADTGKIKNVIKLSYVQKDILSEFL